MAAAKIEWEGLNAEVPKMVQSMKTEWKEATAQAKAGDPVEPRAGAGPRREWAVLIDRLKIKQS